jgi:hypothetical protein
MDRFPEVYPEKVARGFSRSLFINWVLDRGIAVVEAELDAGGWTKGDEDETKI